MQGLNEYVSMYGLPLAQAMWCRYMSQQESFSKPETNPYVRTVAREENDL